MAKEFPHCKVHGEEIAASERNVYRRLAVAVGQDPETALGGEGVPNVREAYPLALESLSICPACVILYAEAASNKFLERAVRAAGGDPDTEKEESTEIDPIGLLNATWVSAFTLGYTVARDAYMPDLDNLIGEK